MLPRHDARDIAPGTAEHLATLYGTTRARTEALVEPLSAEDCAVQSMPDASPVKWHLAHTTWFFETFVLERHADDYRPFHPGFRVLFNSYYNGIGAKHPRPERGMLTRPSLADVFAYRRHVDASIRQMLARVDHRIEAAAALIELGINHEEQHQELIVTDMKHLLSRNPLAPAYGPEPQHKPRPAERRPSRWLRFEGVIREVGAAVAAFFFDNEGPRHRVVLQEFDIATRPVTCGEYLAFVNDGGYRRPDLWLSLGWDAVTSQGWHAPLYWSRDGDRWQLFTLHGMQPVDDDEPVSHVSFFEGDAYARWSGARLPTEFEWEAACVRNGKDGTFLESGVLHPRPPQDEPRDDVLAQCFGDVWEWTQSSYAPYPGYRPEAGAVGEYNGKFMCNQYVLRGGSCATPRRHIRPTYRNFLPPDARWQFSGIRFARDTR